MKRKRLEKTETSERSKIHQKSAITEDIRGRVGTNDTNVANQISSQVDRRHDRNTCIHTRGRSRRGYNQCVIQLEQRLIFGSVHNCPVDEGHRDRARRTR